MANEGDDRDDFLTPDETIRVSSGSYDLDNTLFPNEAAIKDSRQSRPPYGLERSGPARRYRR